MYSEEFFLMQEVQAEQFQLYASMPFFMVSKFCSSNDYLATTIANEFHVSLELAECRLRQIEARIQGVDTLQKFNEVIQEQPVPNSYKTVSKKVVPHYAKSLVAKALLQKQKKEMARQ